ncbi:hypothetical protein A3D01_02070 [Candidatus Woesebacteria bacterium RIFCSPHIGHO2_02_FULL_39_13]|uniref:Uncharacterized protein n=1 Tax=Candidatus Woesebacteria bacterium RIFCSPHIGHO2_02_FULL_39_13 TaxID=1802505 RepID=A0A1F7YXZ3_9BACT|nr:MAG: hypothetical protein A3D01_02070 [Candidatus Woesebacteria bacterium RIFCSPHIGHO2_02_FULL_39_13]OGM71417.1 MAG: hypothetical protein A3H19_04600 [Candidatus Woesebacteria bacterium RIFCSPLOWO2_12_FULL_39_9]
MKPILKKVLNPPWYVIIAAIVLGILLAALGNLPVALIGLVLFLYGLAGPALEIMWRRNSRQR